MNKMILGVVAGLAMLSSPAFAQRDPLKWPFAKTSIWNIPIHNNAVYAPAGIQDATYFEADEDVVIFKPNEPLMKVETNYAGWSGQDRCPVQGPTLFSAPIPSSFIYDKNVWVGRTPNAGVAILQPDGKIWQAQPFAKCAPDVATAQYTWNPSGCVLTGECIEGAHGGSHLSAIGGTIRVGEFSSGKIPHVIKINLFGKENFYQDANGGKRWPATNQDGGYNDPTAYNYYGGTNPEMKIGALLALNKDVVLNSVSDNSLGIKTEAGLILARTLRDYGAYTVDNTAGDSYAFITETGPDGSVRNEFKQRYGYDINGNLGSTDWTSDIKVLFKNLYVITNNKEGNPGGGPVSDLTNRRAPAAPDFSPAQTFKIMPLGDSKTEGGGGGNSQNSWRGYLRTRLIRNGYKLDYVGDRQNYAEGDTLPNDKDHAGHGGYTIGPDIQKFCPTCETTGLYEHIQDYLPQANPDIVLLAIGVNDMFGADVHTPGYMASAPQRYQDLVNKILQLKPGVRLILGTVEPVKWDKNWGSNPSDKSLGALNAKIREIANASDTDNIFLADIYQKMLVTWDPGDYFDDLHLSKQGATKDANAWFDALVPILNNTPANVAPTITLTSPAQSATFAAPATINLEATANDSDGSVTKVEFYNNATKIGEATTSPFQFSWSNVDEGTYALKAVATDNLYATAVSTIDTVTVKSTDGYVKFTGTGIGSPGSYENNGKTFTKALDGDLTTYFDGAVASGQWVGLDLGAARTVRKARIVPRTTWALRIVGGKIQGSNSPDFSNAVDVYTFTQTPIEGFYTTGRFTTTGLYRYYRFLSPSTGYGNIAELEFWGNPNDPTNQVPVCKIDSTLNNTRLAPGASLTLTASASDPDGTITKVEFYSGTALIGTSTAAPYQYVWTNIPVGTYLVTAKATDNAGVSKSSDAVKITVDNLGSDVLYAEDYNTNTAVGWQANGGTWTATNQRYESSNTNGEFTSFYNGASFSNYSYAVDATASWDNNIGVMFNYQNTNNYYLLTFNSKSKTVDLKKKVNGVLTTIASTTFTGGGTGANHAILVTNSGGTTTVKINGNTVFNNVATPDFTSGKIGLYSFYCPSRFDNVVVRSVGGSTTPAPTVALTSPVASATFTAPATITLTASASDAGGISKVEFFNGTTLLGTSTTSPYSYVWSNVAAGTYPLTAKATNTSGTAVTSSTVSVTVGGAATVQEAIAFNKPPMVVNPGQSYTVNVNYTATTRRIIDVYLFNAQYQTIASKNVPVDAGSGTQAVTITIPAGAAPIKGGNWSVNLWKSDWSSAVKSNLVTGVRVNARPTVSLTSPAESATFTAGTAVELAATATDADGTVSKVQFYNGTSLLGTATTSPYAFTITNVSAGTFTLTAKAVDNDSLAATSTARIVEVKPAPSVTPLTITQQPASSSAVCVGTNVQVSVGVDGPAKSYQWFKDGQALTDVASATTATLSLSNVTAANAGTYRVVISGSTSVTSTAFSLTVNASPQVSLTNNGPLTCAGTAVTLTASSAAVGTFAFSGPLGAVTGQANMASVSQPGSYTVLLTDANGCTATATTEVGQNLTPPTMSINPAGPLTCANPTATLTASGTGSFKWSTGETSPSIAVNAGGTYSVVLTGANGCTATASATVSADLTPPTVSVNPAGPLTCANPTATLTASGTGSFKWSTGETSPSIAVNAGGTYSVVLTGANGCSATAVTQVSQDHTPPQGVAANNAGPLTCTKTSASVSAVAASNSVSYQWSGPNGFASSTPGFEASQAGSYTVVVTGGNGCSATATTQVAFVNDLTAPSLRTITGQRYPGDQASVTVPQYSGNVELLAAGCAGTLTWTGPNGTTGTTATIPVATTQTGSFSYSAVCQVGSCTSPVGVATVVVEAAALRMQVPLYNCATRRLTIQTSGGNGQPLEYHIASVTNGWDGPANTFTLESKHLGRELKLRARQRSSSGGFTEVEMSFTPTACGGRVGTASEPGTGLQVVVLGNPVNGSEVSVEVRGAEGQSLHLQLTDMKGTLLSNQLIEQATSAELVRISSGQLPIGILLLRVSTPSQNKTVKILKENP